MGYTLCTDWVLAGAVMRHARKVDPDRFLIQRNGIFYYWRRVPAAFALIDNRTKAGLLRISLKTDDLAEARSKRDLLEAADQNYWEALVQEDGSSEQALSRYQSAARRVETLGFPYRTSSEIASGPLAELLQRILSIMPDNTPSELEAAVLGREARPEASWQDALELLKTRIMRTELAKKSPGQLRRWLNTETRAITEFTKVVGNIPIGATTRAESLKFYNYWLERVIPEGKDATRRLSPSSANKQLGILRNLYRRYHAHIGDWGKESTNPFSQLSLSEKGAKRKRPSFPADWIRDVILAPGALAGMNVEARGITLALIETGCRPAELCNITGADIHLDTEVPYIHVQARSDPENPRDIKTEQSDRSIPLVGVALAVFKRHPGGFPQYVDKENTYSATANKFMWENGLKPTKRHVVYSLRHSFEDRMIEGGFDLEVREVLVGHSLKRPVYGEKGSLQFRQKLLSAIAFDYDPSII